MTRAKCKHCQRYFESKWNKQYCSAQCVKDHNKAVRDAEALATRGPGFPCPTCGTLMYRKNRRWCSNKCIPRDVSNRYRSDQWSDERATRMFPEIKEERKRILEAFRSAQSPSRGSGTATP